MLSRRLDPYLFFKLLYTRRAQMACWLSADLGLYRALGTGRATEEELCSKMGLQPRPLRMLLAANGSLGLVRQEAGLYSLQHVMRPFVLPLAPSDNHTSMTARGQNHLYDSWKKSLQDNAPQSGWAPPWIADPEGKISAPSESAQRDALREEWGRSLARAMDWTGIRNVADVGGATGEVLVSLTSLQPHVQGVVVDLPYCREEALAAIARSGASTSVAFWEADVFEETLSSGIDAIFMSHALHDWDDATCIHLLRRCHEALPPDAPLVAIEFLLDEDKMGPFLAAIQWLWLVLGTSGDQRTGPEIAALLAEAGFHELQTLPVDEHESIVIGWKR